MSLEMLDINGIKVANIKNQSGIAFFGIAVLAGSNYETPEIAGISHFAEHLFFKGTKSRNWKQINEEFAKLGVMNNAYTSNTEVLYHATCPKENLEKVIALMMDMFFNSTVPKEEMEKERNVIMEEKKMYEDDPKTAFSNAIGKNMFHWKIGHDTIGTFETIRDISRENVLQYLKDKTTLENMVFICAGDVDSADLKRYIGNNLPSQHPYLRSSGSMNDVGCDHVWSDAITKSDKVKFLMERDNITQSSVYMMINALPAGHPLYYVEAVLYEALGGGMYSRLFSRIREELGLCYAVGMFTMPLDYPSHRIGNLYGYVSPENVEKFMIESEKVLQDVIKNGLDKDIFECAKTDYLASLLRQTETSLGKAMYASKKLLIYKKASLEDTIEKIRSVTREECNELAGKILNVQYNWAVMNPSTKVR